jgi:WD40 repeat protein/transcriptional regulator with XRE-family HTH domain
MGTTAYDERDYAFGQVMLTLRTEIGLTQAGLAKELGVSRRAVGEWEAGSSYPKPQHLKEVVALGVKSQAFRVGHEAEEIRALWKAACQKVLLDERWLSSLLESSHTPLLHLVPKTIEESMTVEVGRTGASPVPATPLPCACSVTEPLPNSVPRVDWSDALAVPIFYGREEELALLSQGIVQEHCHVVSVLGMGGIGKSALSVSAMYQISGHFEVVIFRSLRDSPSFEELLDECLQVLSPQPTGQGQGTVPTDQRIGQLSSGQGQGTVPTDQRIGLLPGQGQGTVSTDQRIGLLLAYLRKMRVLVVLDNLESLLEAGDPRGRLRPSFEGYGHFLRRVSETAHQSCLLLTSREKLADLRPLESKHSPVRSLRLSGLDEAACKRLLVEKEVVGAEAEQERLIEIYGGNPLALKIVAETIFDLFGGEIGLFLAEETLIFGGIADLLGEQFARLSALEKTVLYWLSIAREPMTLDELQEILVSPLPRIRVLEAVDGLRRRSLIERGKRAGSFTLQAVVMEYVTAALIAEGSREIQQQRLNLLIEHGLSQAKASEYVRQIQERLLLSPLLARLQMAYSGGTDVGSALGTTPTGPVEGQLLSLLNQLREQADSAQGYGPANLIALLRLQRGNLNRLDLSKLCIRGASLHGIEMQATSLCGALIRDTVLTEAVSDTRSVAISQDGAFWAAGGLQGEVRVWGEGGRTLLFIWQAHTDAVQTLAFSPDGRTLASGSLDNTVRLWDVRACSHGVSPCHALLWMNRHNCPFNLVFSPDGYLLACAGMSSTVPLWDTQSGVNLQRLEHPAHVLAVAWSPNGRPFASTCFDGQLRLWERQEAQPRPHVEILQLSTSWETGAAKSLAFAPDGTTLVSAGWKDRRVRLWDVGSGRLLHTFEGETNQINRVVWSPDGRTLASCSYQKAIWLWDVEQRRHRATLSGHTSDINGMAFTPDSQRLLSGSADSTLRVWDVESGQCMRVMQGYAVSYHSFDWSPNGSHLVSGGTDGVVTLWDLGSERPPKELRGHTWAVYGVGWSPDGRFVASCGGDAVVRLWNPTTHASVRVLENCATPFQGMSWSPDGRLLAVGTYLYGMCVWDVREGRLHWVGEPDRDIFVSAAWSPDGSLLAGGSNDGNVYLWQRADGMRREELSGHRGYVRSLAWSPDGAMLASGGGDRGSGELFLWDMQACKVCRDGTRVLDQPSTCPPPLSLPMRTFTGHSGMVYAVVWSRGRTGASEQGQAAVPTGSYGPRGDRLISGGEDGRLYWWDVESGECVNVQEACHGTIRALRVSPDGKFLASCGDDGAIRIWDLESGEHLRTLRRDRPYERLNITGVRGLNEAEIASLRALGAIEEVGP